MKLTFTEMTHADGDKSMDFTVDDGVDGNAAIQKAMDRFRELSKGNFAFTSGKGGEGKKIVRSFADIGVDPGGEDKEIVWSPILTGG